MSDAPRRDVSDSTAIGECDHCGGNAHSLLGGEHIWKCSDVVPVEALLEFGERLAGAVSTMRGEADELSARRPHPDAHLYDVESGLRHRADELEAFLEEEYYR